MSSGNKILDEEQLAQVECRQDQSDAKSETGNALKSGPRHCLHLPFIEDIWHPFIKVVQSLWVLPGFHGQVALLLKNFTASWEVSLPSSQVVIT